MPAELDDLKRRKEMVLNGRRSTTRECQDSLEVLQLIALAMVIQRRVHYLVEMESRFHGRTQ
jgi:hypothetical protein